jgi:hypothetical protein
MPPTRSAARYSGSSPASDLRPPGLGFHLSPVPVDHVDERAIIRCFGSRVEKWTSSTRAVRDCPIGSRVAERGTDCAELTPVTLCAQSTTRCSIGRVSPPRQQGSRQYLVDPFVGTGGPAYEATYAREPRHGSSRWEVVRYALGSNARTARLCVIWVVVTGGPVAGPAPWGRR